MSIRFHWHVLYYIKLTYNSKTLKNLINLDLSCFSEHLHVAGFVLASTAATHM